ncbi:hypothetical protein [Pseudomonas sp. 1152_12]|uniref:hypothetical protein n=1 Tax=Pseudomonas sp. 1152_12 TaxID=2604455 RepID=UPI0040646625
MIKNVVVIVLGVFVAGCSYFDVKPRETEEGPIIARAFFSDQACTGTQGVSESLLGAAAVTWGVTKASELVVGYVTDAVAQAAKADKETVTITGQNPDYLFKVQDEKIKMRGCLYVVVAPRVAEGQFCLPVKGKKGNWYNPVSCKTVSSELVSKWRDWSLGTPTFFAEISFRQPEGGPVVAVIPEVRKIYYPQPISTMKEDKVKGFSILVTASKPTKSTRVSGDTVLEVFLGGDGVTPRTVRAKQSLQTSGLWVVVPSVEGGAGKDFAGPVNLTVTVAETPHPTAWLQSVASFVAANKQKAVDMAVAKLDPKAVAKAEADELANASKYRSNAADLCTALSTEMEKLQQAQIHFKTGQFTSAEVRLRAGYAMDSACETTRNAGNAAASAWSLAERGGQICNRSQDPKVEMAGMCR